MNKLTLTAATVLIVCLLPISNAQETVNENEYGMQGSVVMNPAETDFLLEGHDFPHCIVRTGVDLFTDEEMHRIYCTSGNVSIMRDFTVSFAAHISSNEDDSEMIIDLLSPSTDRFDPIRLEIEEGESLLVRIDQNPPEILNLDAITELGSGRIEKSNTIKNFLTKVKHGQQRLVVRIGDKQNSTREMSLQNGNVAAAIEDFLNRTENLPAFRIQN